MKKQKKKIVFEILFNAVTLLIVYTAAGLFGWNVCLCILFPFLPRLSITQIMLLQAGIVFILSPIIMYIIHFSKWRKDNDN